MANIRVHYQINDFQLQDESNFTGNNFVFRMDTPNVPFGLPDGNLGINTDYKVYKSKCFLVLWSPVAMGKDISSR